MNKKQKIQSIIEILEYLFPNPSIGLYYYNDFTLLIAILLSSRSRDKKVNEITPILFAKADTPEKMLKMNIKDIIYIIKGIGLYNIKAVNIHKISSILIKKYNSLIPNNFLDLESLPGIGHKTASIIMMYYFNHITFPVDTHIHRLMFLWGLSNGKSIKQTEMDAKRLFPKNIWNKIHLQIINYGKTYTNYRNYKKDIIYNIITSK